MLSNNVKRMSIKEFQEKGYLQEVNRQFLHPLGLALEIIISDDNEPTLGGVWDHREDSEGLYYDLENSNNKRIERFEKNKKFIQNEFKTRSSERIKLFNNIIEPIPTIKKEK